MMPDASTLTAADPDLLAAVPGYGAGEGLVELAVVGGRTEVVGLRAESPLRLLSPRSRSEAAWVVAGSYGGGLVSGDRLSVNVRCRPHTCVVLGTQATTKIYRNRIGAAVGLPAACRQEISATLDDGATLVSWPDPVTCFKGSRFVQRQTFRLSSTASLVAVDWMTSGRMARGERWAFESYRTETSIYVDGRLRLRDSTTLDPLDGPFDVTARTAGFDVLGMAWVVGPRFSSVAAGLMSRLERDPIDPRRDVLYGISPLADPGTGDAGVVIRFAARSTDAGWRWLRSQLSGVLDVIGIDPWSRRG